MSGAEFQYPDRTWKEVCGLMANIVADSGGNKGQLSLLVINRKTNTLWDGTIATDDNTRKPLRLMVRNICGDETKFVIEVAGIGE